MSALWTILMLGLLASAAYAWLLFPLLLRLAAQSRPAAPAGGEPAPGPASVAVVLSAYNEAQHIGDRIRNLLEEAPAGARYEIHVGVDASSDDTAVEARRAASNDARVNVYAFTERRGKVAVIKELVARCTTDIIVFTDANTFFIAGAMRALLAPFRDAAVGGVCGRLALVTTLPPGGHVEAQTDATAEEGFYWRWETTLKLRESALDSCLGANGAIFALRRPLFWSAIPENTMVDDFVIGMKVREQGARVVYAPAAVAVEELPHIRDEWVRRVRIGAGDYQALVLCRRCLSPRHGWFAWCFWSHKVLRWFTPHAVVLLALAAGGALAWGGPYARALALLVLAGLVAAAALALLGAALQAAGTRWGRLPRLWLHFVSMQAALLAGFWRFAAGNLTGHWTRTPRTAGQGPRNASSPGAP